jgi:hypothetical protein
VPGAGGQRARASSKPITRNWTRLVEAEREWAIAGKAMTCTPSDSWNITLGPPASARHTSTIWARYSEASDGRQRRASYRSAAPLAGRQLARNDRLRRCSATRAYTNETGMLPSGLGPGLICATGVGEESTEAEPLPAIVLPAIYQMRARSRTSSAVSQAVSFLEQYTS